MIATEEQELPWQRGGKSVPGRGMAGAKPLWQEGAGKI